MKTRVKGFTPKKPAPIEEMTAADLDIAVANEVMGWKLATKKTDNPKYRTAYQWQDANGRAFWASSGLFGWGWHDQPTYPPAVSIDTLWAMRVADQMQKKGFWCHITIPGASGAADVSFHPEDGLGIGTQAGGESLAQAICRAALKCARANKRTSRRKPTKAKKAAGKPKPKKQSPNPLDMVKGGYAGGTLALRC